MGSLGNPKEAQTGSFSSPAAKWNPTPPPQPPPAHSLRFASLMEGQNDSHKP